jgi:hypothetical protein
MSQTARSGLRVAQERAPQVTIPRGARGPRAGKAEAWLLARTSASDADQARALPHLVHLLLDVVDDGRLAVELVAFKGGRHVAASRVERALPHEGHVAGLEAAAGRALDNGSVRLARAMAAGLHGCGAAAQCAGLGSRV